MCVLVCLETSSTIRRVAFSSVPLRAYWMLEPLSGQAWHSRSWPPTSKQLSWWPRNATTLNVMLGNGFVCALCHTHVQQHLFRVWLILQYGLRHCSARKPEVLCQWSSPDCDHLGAPEHPVLKVARWTILAVRWWLMPGIDVAIPLCGTQLLPSAGAYWGNFSMNEL